jgi:hypothetical protein
MIDRPDTNLQLRKINNSWWLNETIRSVALSPVLGAMAAKLMGTEEVRLWHDQAIWKPGQGCIGKGASTTADHTTRPDEATGGDWSQESNVGWHQDYAHWQVSSTMNMCTAFIVLQDTDLSNGGLRTIARSHKRGLLEVSKLWVP